MTALNAVEDFIIDLYLADVDSESTRQNFSSFGGDLDKFKALVHHNKVAPYMHNQLKKIGHPFAAELTAEHDRIREQNTQRLQAGLPVLLELQQRGVDVIILKGNAIAEEVFQDIGYKPMNDIDILVKQKDLDTVYEVFQKHRLVSAGALDEDFRKQEKYSHHWPPFFTQDLRCFFGTHWNLAAAARGMHLPVEKFWQNKESFVLLGNTFFRLSPAHFVLHLCVHLSPVKTGLREVGDIVKVVTHREKDLDVDLFTEMVKEAKAEEDVYEALSLANSISAVSFIKEVISKLTPLIPEKKKQEVKKRCEPRRKILLMRTNYISKIEKAFALFMLTEAPLEKTVLLAKMWKHLLLVPPQEAYRLSGVLPEAGLFAKLGAIIKAPLKVSQVFIKDLGLFVFVFVTLRHEWILIASYGGYVIKKIKGVPTKDLKSVAALLGLDLGRIKEISALD